jgi:diguanylate cyclase
LTGREYRAAATNSRSGLGCRRLIGISGRQRAAAVLTIVRWNRSRRIEASSSTVTTPDLARVLLHTLADNVPHRIYAKDAQGRFTFANRSVALGMGVDSPEVLLGRTDADFYAGADADEYARQEREVMASGEPMIDRKEHVRYPLRGDEAWLLTTKVPMRDDSGAVIGLVGINYDITRLELTEQMLRRAHEDAQTAHAELASTVVRLEAEMARRSQLEDELRRQASHDALTGLPNRVLLMDRLDVAIRQAERSRRGLTLLFIDLDRFKSVNDSFGHGTGDALLQRVAERMGACVRACDTFARLAGDEFVMLLADEIAEPDLLAVVARIAAAIAEPMDLDGHEISITCSVGCSVYPQDGADATTLLEHADAAMYSAKQSGRNNVRRYSPAMQTKLGERIGIESQLRRAIGNHELRLHYQPQLDLATGAIVGVEALVRWQHPQWGLVMPGRFIGIAEDSGLIEPMGRWVLETACAQAVAWQQQGLPPMRMAVNISPAQFGNPDLERQVQDALRITGLHAHLLELELTESLSMRNPDQTIRTLERLGSLGVEFAIDDFGTGYSNLAYLRRLPVDRIKLDRSFITDSGSDAIVEAVVAMAHKLGLEVVAEGVETLEQRDRLGAFGCDLLQGYWFSRPVEAAGIEALLSRQARAV